MSLCSLPACGCLKMKGPYKLQAYMGILKVFNVNRGEIG